MGLRSARWPLATDLSSKAWVHWLGLTVYVVIAFSIQYFDLKSRFFSKVVDGEPTVVMQNAKFLERNLKKSMLTKVEMLLREKNIFDPTQVEYAIMEPDGNLSVLYLDDYAFYIWSDRFNLLIKAYHYFGMIKRADSFSMVQTVKLY